MNQKTNGKATIIGAGEAGYAISTDLKPNAIHTINRLFWDEKGNEALGTTALPFYGAFLSEEKCRLFGKIEGKKLLEIGCGTGLSLAYLGERKAGELWGLDLSNEQIKKAKKHLSDCNVPANLICSPMETSCGIPENYFDIVYSIYAIGWTTDLEGTFRRISSYLKTGGSFIFSWSHPVHKCAVWEDGTLLFKKCYFDESWYTVSFGNGTLSLCDRKLSTYINALAKAGFAIEELVEETDTDLTQKDGGSFAKKAEMLPVTFVVKAKKL